MNSIYKNRCVRNCSTGFKIIHPNYFRGQLLRGGKLFEPGSLFCHFMIWVLTLMIQAFRILYRVNVVKFVKLVILWQFWWWITMLLSERRTDLTRECVEGQAPRIPDSRAKSVLLKLRNIIIHHRNYHDTVYNFHEFNSVYPI